MQRDVCGQAAGGLDGVKNASADRDEFVLGDLVNLLGDHGEFGRPQSVVALYFVGEVVVFGVMSMPGTSSAVLARSENGTLPNSSRGESSESSPIVTPR